MWADHDAPAGAGQGAGTPMIAPVIAFLYGRLNAGVRKIAEFATRFA